MVRPAQNVSFLWPNDRDIERLKADEKIAAPIQKVTRISVGSESVAPQKRSEGGFFTPLVRGPKPKAKSQGEREDVLDLLSAGEKVRKEESFLETMVDPEALARRVARETPPEDLTRAQKAFQPAAVVQLLV